MPKHYENLLAGKAFVCWNCEENGILDSENMKFDFPWCLNCRINTGINGTSDIINENYNARIKHAENINFKSVNEVESNKSEVVKIDKKKLDELFGIK